MYALVKRGRWILTKVLFSANHHQYHPGAVIDVAVVTSSRDTDQSCVRCFAVAVPRFSGRGCFRWF